MPMVHRDTGREHQAPSTLSFYPFLNIHFERNDPLMKKPDLQSLKSPCTNLSSGILLCRIRVIAALCVSSFGVLQEFPGDTLDRPVLKIASCFSFANADSIYILDKGLLIWTLSIDGWSLGLLCFRSSHGDSAESSHRTEGDHGKL
jgi:hypothetical protein